MATLLSVENFKSFELKFLNSRTKQSLSVRFQIDDHSLAQRWAGMLKDLLLAEAHLEKNYLFHGWLGTRRDVPFLCTELNRHIKIINEHFTAKPDGLTYFIDQTFDPMTVDQLELNKIHHDFEILIGQAWSEAKTYTLAPPFVKNSIRQLNNLCHEIENLRSSEKYMKEGRCSAGLIAAFFPKPTQKLLPEDAEHFDLRYHFGDVKLHYAQLGKTHQEAYADKDEVIHDTGISELRYLSGEFDIFLSDESNENVHERNIMAFKNWLVSKNIDPNLPNLGYAIVAHLDRGQFPGKSSLEIMKLLFNYDDISTITLKSDKASYRQRYEYQWWDADNESKQIHIQSYGVAPRTLTMKFKNILSIFR